jgi:hypothetical protein
MIILHLSLIIRLLINLWVLLSSLQFKGTTSSSRNRSYRHNVVLQLKSLDLRGDNLELEEGLVLLHFLVYNVPHQLSIDILALVLVNEEALLFVKNQAPLMMPLACYLIEFYASSASSSNCLSLYILLIKVLFALVT